MAGSTLLVEKKKYLWDFFCFYFGGTDRTHYKVKFFWTNCYVYINLPLFNFVLERFNTAVTVDCVNVKRSNGKIILAN